MRARLALSFFGLLCALCLVSAADQPEWLTDFEKAKETAKKEKKVILADFTGSDWCGWCIKLKAEVFDTDAFRTWAAKNVILLELDFPKQKQLSADLKAQNAKLAATYQVEGFPTILFLDADGEVLGKSGYMAGGPVNWTTKADETLANKPKKVLKGVGDNLADSLAAAKEANLPLLVIFTNDSKTDQNRTTPLFDNAEFKKLTDGRVLAVKVPFPAPKELDANAKADIELIAKQYHISNSTYLLVDVAKNKMMLSKPIAFTNDAALMTAINAVMPKPVYNGEWLEDYAKAVELSKKTGHPMLLDFTGSDWCGWCMKLDKEVFSQDDFKKYAVENFILVKLDFPKQKFQAAELKKQNNDLLQQFRVQGFPTVLVVNGDGKLLGDTGYMEGGPTVFNAALKKILNSAGK